MEYMSSLQDGLDQYKPSLFEILAENQLSALIPPSLRYLLTVATYRRPRYLLRILNSFDELHAILMLLLERHFLKTYGGSFTEHFYGLKRERVPQIKGGEAPRAQFGVPELLRETLKLRERDIWANLTVLIGVPYLKRKLDQSYEIHVPQASIIEGGRYNRDNGLPTSPTLRQRIFYYYKWFLRKAYPSLNAAYYFSLLAFNLAYLFSHTAFSSPFLYLLNTRLRRLSLADQRAIAALESSTSPSKPGQRPGQGTSIFSPKLFGRTALGSLKLLLPASIFALKFLEWYHASDFGRQLARKATEGLELPPPIISGLPRLGPQQSLGPAPPTQPAQQASYTQHAAEKNAPPNSVALAPQPPAVPTPSSTPAQTQPTTLPPPPPPAVPRPLAPPRPPLSSTTGLPIYTLPPPPPSSPLCPICDGDIVTPTATGSGYVYCYTCVFRWVGGEEAGKQGRFMDGVGEWWGKEEEDEQQQQQGGKEKEQGQGQRGMSRRGVWESGEGRDPVTGRRVLGGREGLRRVMA